MKEFHTYKILENNEIIAKELRRARQEKKISLKDASRDLKMNQKYLEALERGNFEELPTGVYRVNFLREYAIYLGLSAKELTALFGETEKEKKEVNINNYFVKKATNVHYFVTIPKLIKNLLIVVAVSFCLVYLAFYLNNIIAPPELQIIYPPEDFVTIEKEVLVQGQSDVEAEVYINNVLVLTNQTGSFEKSIKLKSGLNTIVVVASKKYSRENKQERKILVNNP
ncbi:hypothetical protein C0583_05895 [Candidatus Parcubacteria bacterium]|nr:MAG: hypothetical protein C0583_05895 [Candidatus Parcubacteria bacterium]